MCPYSAIIFEVLYVCITCCVLVLLQCVLLQCLTAVCLTAMCLTAVCLTAVCLTAVCLTAVCYCYTHAEHVNSDE